MGLLRCSSLSTAPQIQYLLINTQLSALSTHMHTQCMYGMMEAEYWKTAIHIPVQKGR